MAAKSAAKKNMTYREAALVVNSMFDAVGGMFRRGSTGKSLDTDPRRKIDEECGYLSDPTNADYINWYYSNGLAARVVNLLTEACFSDNPVIYETERPRDTPFEKKLKSLIKHPTLNPHYYVRKADALSGVCTFSALYIAVNDGKPIDTIADGMNEDGQAVPRSSTKERQILYFRAMDESSIRVKETNNDTNSPRNGQPQTYEMDVEERDSYGAKKIVTKIVHWSRILHVAECEGPSELYAIPKMKRVFPQLQDCRKILGGSGEMFWKGGFPGIAATVDPRFIEAGGIDVDEDSITDEMQRYMDGLQKHLLGVGFQITSLAPQVADPTAHLMMQFTVIAIALGIPLPVFMGQVEAKMASAQNMKNWNTRVGLRRNEYLTPRVYRPLIHRLIAMGVLPMTKQQDDFGFPVFEVWWPDVAKPDDNEKSTVADRRAAAIMKYVMSGGHQLLQPSDFLRFVLGYEQEEIDTMMENIKKTPEIKFKDPKVDGKADGSKKPVGKAPSSGSKGTPPSNSRPRNR